MANHYETLGITPQAGDKEIKAAYRKLAKQYHPDAVAGHPELADRMYEIQAAYEVLGNEAKKKKYDEDLKKGSQQGQPGGSAGGSAPTPNMSSFEKFFGFQPGKGMETYQDRRQDRQKQSGPIDVEKMFEAYFKKK